MSATGTTGLAVPRAMARAGDQASRLRELAAEPPAPSVAPHRPFMIAIGSGKGGVGKTVTSVNLCLALASMGLRSVLVDADIGTANADVVLGVQPGKRLDDLIAEGCVSGAELERIAVPIAPGFRLIPGSVGVAAEGSLARSQRELVGDWLSSIERTTDVVVVDTGAGVGHAVTEFVAAADLGVIVVTPEPTSIADAYALYKSVLMTAGTGSGSRIGFLVNQATDEGEARKVHARIASVASRFLRSKPGMLGWIPADAEMVRAVRRQAPVILESPGAGSAVAIGELASRLCSRVAAARDSHAEIRPTGRRSRRGWLARIFGMSENRADRVESGQSGGRSAQSWADS